MLNDEQFEILQSVGVLSFGDDGQLLGHTPRPTLARLADALLAHRRDREHLLRCGGKIRGLLWVVKRTRADRDHLLARLRGANGEAGSFLLSSRRWKRKAQADRQRYKRAAKLVLYWRDKYLDSAGKKLGGWARKCLEVEGLKLQIVKLEKQLERARKPMPSLLSTYPEKGEDDERAKTR